MTGGQQLSELDLRDLSKKVPKDATDGADFIAEHAPNALSFNAESKTWYVWNGTVHTPLQTAVVPMQLIDILGYAYKELGLFIDEQLTTQVQIIEAGNLSEDDAKKAISELKVSIVAARKHWEAFAYSLNSNKGVNDVLSKLERRVAKGPGYFENDRQWLVVRNGVIDLQEFRRTDSVTLHAHDASRPVTRFFDADYDPSADAAIWKAFLSSSIVDDCGDTVRLLQKAVGAAFSAEEKPRALFNLQGAPASGKSVFLSVFNRLGQAYSVMPNNQAIQLNNGDTNFYQDALRNKRFVGFSEVQGKKPLDDGFLKGILGGDEQNTRQMRQMESPWKPQCVLFIASNMALKFDTRDEATFIKILPISFPHSFTETDPEHQMDRELENKVLEERSGILNWILEGMLSFWDEGLAPTAAVMAAMDGNKTANSHALQFMEALIESGNVIQDPGAPLSGCLGLTAAYEMFRHWSESQGIRNVPGKQTFSSDVADYYYGKGRSDGVRFIGLSLSPELSNKVQTGVSHFALAKDL